jgi:hypothetical protein
MKQEYIDYRDAQDMAICKVGVEVHWKIIDSPYYKHSYQHNSMNPTWARVWVDLGLSSW